jgi:hypothetical protein
MPRTHSEWQRRIIARLLTQETGRHFLDSGGAYGRHWERNAIKTDEQLTGWDYNIEVRPTHFQVSRNVADWLYEGFDFDREHTKRMMAFSRTKKFREEDWSDCLKAYIESIDGCILNTKSGNTCNYQTLLTQNVHYVGIDLPDRCGDYYAVRVHQGCDLRGGYGEFVIAEATDEMFNFSSASLYCKNGHYLYTDDAYHWYLNGECSSASTFTDDNLKIASNAHTWWLQCPECKCKLEVGR